MDRHLIVFLSVIAAFLLALATVAGFYWKRSRASSKAQWEQLIARFTFIDRDSIQRVALDHIDSSGWPRSDEGARSLNSSEIWKLIGGMQGLEVLEANCAVLIDMACYLQRWYPEAMTTAEQLRKSAEEIQWHVGRLKGAVIPEKVASEFADYARPAIASYYLMTRRILALYEDANFPGLIKLQRTI
jgi:hypothetical protein